MCRIYPSIPKPEICVTHQIEMRNINTNYLLDFCLNTLAVSLALSFLFLAKRRKPKTYVVCERECLDLCVCVYLVRIRQILPNAASCAWKLQFKCRNEWKYRAQQENYGHYYTKHSGKTTITFTKLREVRRKYYYKMFLVIYRSNANYSSKMFQSDTL